MIAAIQQDTPNARVHSKRSTLPISASVRALAKRLNTTLPRLDVLINNAGIMEPPERGVSADGFEMQFAVNYLGHFVLTAELLPLLKKANSPRVVTLSSIAARGGSLHFSDLQFAQDYDPGAAYSQSKLACLMFALELQRRSDAAHWGIQSIAAHPGVSRTDLLIHRTGFTGMVRRNLSFLFQPAAQGALPILFAATSPEAQGGGYYGPDRLSETRGDPRIAKVPTRAPDTASASRLWLESEQLRGTDVPVGEPVTGVDFALPAKPGET